MSLDPILLVRRWPERRNVVLATAVVGFIAVVVAEAAADHTGLTLSVLYPLPVMLVALELGLTGGLASAALAIGLLVAGDPQLDPFTVAVHGLVVVFAGAIAGRFSDRMRAAHAREQRLLDSGLILGELGGHAQLAQAVATAALRTPRVVGVRVELEGRPSAVAGRAVGRSTATDIVARGTRLGRITVRHDAALEPEDRGALELLAIQAALAADNQRLVIQERDAARLAAELRRGRDELLEQRSGLAHILDAQEQERRRFAETLHEELAQVLAAVLLGLRMLRRQVPRDGETSLDELHGQVVGVLDEVRDLAGELSPSSLAQLGLVPALQALTRGGDRAVVVDADGLPEPLPEPLSRAVYRLVEHMLAVARGNAPAAVRLRAADRRLEVVVDVDLAGSAEPLAAARARAALVDGSLQAEPLPDGRTRVCVRVPLQPPLAADAPPTGRAALTTVLPAADSISI